MTKSKLRREAEQRINQQEDKQTETEKSEDRQLQQIIEELQIYQVELDIQNDELRQANDELEATRNRYADLYDLAPVGYFTLGKNSRIIEVNLTGTSMLGMNREKLLDCKLTAFIDHSAQDKFFRCFRRCLRDGKKISCDLKFKQITGESFFAHLEGNLMEAETEVAPCCRVVLSDITDRFNAEKALRSARDQWIRTFESISDSVTILDTEMRVVKANRACALLLKQSATDLLDRFCHDIFRNQENVCSKCPVKQVLKTGKSESMEITNDLLHKTFQVSASPIMDENGQLTGVVQIARDITERKILEKQLVQAQKMEAIGTLAGGIAHDFNNILTAVIGYAKLGMLRLPDNRGKDIILDSYQLGQLTNYLQEIYSAGERAGKLVSQILTFSRQHKIIYKPMELAPIVKESVKFLRSTLPSTITIELYIHPEPVSILADPTQLLQVLMNLCTNAAHAMQEHGGTLTIELQPRILNASEADFYQKLEPGRYVELRISDTGHGMSSEFMERIFDPFFTTKDKGQGTGLVPRPISFD